MITDDQLDAIDVVLAGGGGKTTHYFSISKGPAPTLVRDAGFEMLADKPRHNARSPYEKTDWAMRLSDNRCAPVLHILATIKHGTLPPDAIPYWKDKNPTNQTLDNVVLDRKTLKKEPTSGIRSKYGVRAGTKEYWKLYWQDPVNKRRGRETAKRNARKKRQRERERRQKEGVERMEKLLKDAVGEDTEIDIEALAKQALEAADEK